MRSLQISILTVLGLGILPAAASGAAAPPDLPPEDTLISLIVSSGGPFGWCIVACSVLGVALLIEHALSITAERAAPRDAIRELTAKLDAKDLQGAYDFCEQHPGHLTRILAAALPKAPHGFESMSQAASDVAEEEAIRLQSKISWCALIANIAPLLGLLGTVSGMLTSFGVIERTPNPTPSQLGGGIKQALVTTLMGLTVAIPISVGFFYFRNKVVRIVLEVAAVYEDLLDRFRPHPEA